MGSTDPANAIFPIDLGTAAAFDRNVFPLAYYEDRGGNFSKGCFLIRATLDEMEKIKQLGIDLNKNEDFIFDTRLSLEALKVEKAKLQDNRKTINPFKAFLNYRAARFFHATSKAVYIQTKRTSEQIHREEQRVRVVPSTQMRLVDDAISPDAVIGGFSIDLPDGLNDNAKRTINYVTDMISKATDPFQDNSLISQLRDDEQEITLAGTASVLSQVEDVYDSSIDGGNQTPVASSDLQLSRPTSPQTINHIHYNIIQHSIVTTNSSNLNGFTANSGERNSGASVAQESAP